MIDAAFLSRHHALHAQRAPRVSAWSVGEHCDHVYTAGLVICAALAVSAATTPRRESSGIITWLSLSLGWIPRGKATAPAAVQPVAAIDQVRLDARGAAYLDQRRAAEGLPDHGGFDHPVFGHLRRRRALRFVDVHATHHAKIVRDILRCVT